MDHDTGLGDSRSRPSERIDWWEVVLPDVVPALRKNRNVVVDIADPFGMVGYLVINHLYPPFNDARARRAILMALSQEDCMRAYVGDDERLWKPMPGYFAPGVPLYTEEGGDILNGPRNLDVAKQLLAESGYAGQPVTLMAAQDLTYLKAFGEVIVDRLRRLDVNVDYAAVDWGTVVARRAKKEPPSQGGWNMYITNFYGVDNIDPTNKMIRSGGDLSVNGWSSSLAVEAEIAAWYDAKNLDEEKLIARRLNRVALNHVVYAPLGVYLRLFGRRKNLNGVGRAPLPLPWGVSKTA
jgi:peptide/nickel transport system substrate-binding protein